MKQTASLLLLSMYQGNRPGAVQIASERLRWLVPELSESGYRSLLHLLEQRAWVFREEVVGRVRYSITDSGERALKAQFPALSERFEHWDGSWRCIVFQKPPKSDSGFRYLRSLVHSEGAVALARGTYILPTCTERLQNTLERLYEQSVLVFKIGEWQMGSERPIVSELYALTDVADSYSGASSEAEKLLSNLSSKGELNDQQKLQIRNSWVRLLIILQEDPGFTHQYFPECPGYEKILHDLQAILML